ncbi:MAG: V-type ATP synthase subunit C [Lachnoclostridium sp.]|nr:V-type ATP synthase subunit C [Lachnoclostridium sp.]
MKSENFVEASSYIRVIEKKLLSSDSIRRISEASTAAEALKQISGNSGYDFSSLNKTSDYEKVLKQELKETYQLLYKISPQKEVVDILADKYVFHNIKVTLKAKYIQKDSDHLYLPIAGPGVLPLKKYILDNEKDDVLPEFIIQAIDDAEKVYEESKDPQDIDIILDKHMYQDMLMLCKEVHNDLITEHTKMSVDFHNIKAFVRVKSMDKGTRFLGKCLVSGGLTNTEYFLSHYDKSPDVISSVFYYKYFGDVIKKGMESYNRTGNYSDLEKLFDDTLIELTKKSKYLAFGPEVLFTYLLSKENEIRQVRILITCKNNGIQAETLKERLRDNYV